MSKIFELIKRLILKPAGDSKDGGTAHAKPNPPIKPPVPVPPTKPKEVDK